MSSLIKKIPYESEDILRKDKKENQKKMINF